MNRKDLFVVFLIFLFAYYLRVLFLPAQSLTFGYDQARDAINARQILAGDLKIQGPPSSANGLYHGVFYYYFLAPAYLMGKGSPIFTAYYMALFNAAVVFLVYFLTYLFTKNKSVSALSSVFYAVSFESTQYATWLSNPTIAIWTVPLFYLGLWIWTKENSKFWKKIGPAIVGIGLGLSVQAEIFLLYHVVPLIIWIWFSRKKISLSQLVNFIFTFLITISTIVISEFKFGFKGISGIFSLLTTNDSIVAAKGLGDFVVLFLNQIGKVFAYNSFPLNIGYGGAFVLILVAITFFNIPKKEKNKTDWKPFLVTWLLSHLSVVTVGGTSTPFLLVGIAPAITIILGIYIYKLYLNNKFIGILLTIIVVSANLIMIFKDNPHGSTIFSIQKEMTLKNQFDAINFTYEDAKGRDFSINTVTSPLWINIVWSYLYKWHGETAYSYLPSWYGRSQVGQIDQLSEVENPTKVHYLILEPLQGIPPQYVQEVLNEEDSKSRILEEKKFGQIVVQKRENKNESVR